MSVLHFLCAKMNRDLQKNLIVPTRMRTDIPLIASILGENGESNPVQVTSASTTYTADLGFVLVDDDVLPANYGIGEKQDWTKK